MHIRALVLVCLASTMFAAPRGGAISGLEPGARGELSRRVRVDVLDAPAGIVILSGSLAPLATAGVDFVREFNLENERFMEFRSVLKGGKHKVRVSRVPFKYEQTAVLQRPVVFGDGRSPPTPASPPT